MSIATEILKQLGGNKFIAMTGSKNFISSDNALTMALTKNLLKAKWLRIELTQMDTYTLTFIKAQRKKNEYGLFDTVPINIKKIKGIYNDNLQEIFTEQTGLDTHL